VPVDAAVGRLLGGAAALRQGPHEATAPRRRPCAALAMRHCPCRAGRGGPTALAVLVEAALGPIHSAALVETALGPIHGAVLGRSPSPALPVETAFGRLLGDAIGNQVGVAFDVTAKAALVEAAQCSTSRSGDALLHDETSHLFFYLVFACRVRANLDKKNQKKMKWRT
jgi:hypothetical protein